MTRFASIILLLQQRSISVPLVSCGTLRGVQRDYFLGLTARRVSFAVLIIKIR